MTIASPNLNATKHHHPKHANTPLGHTLSLIENPSSTAGVRFLIMDCPTESTLSLYLEEFKNYDVSIVVRCCQPTYSPQRLLENGIKVIDLPFRDGGVPPPPVIQEWLNVIQKAKAQSGTFTIAVHCVAGLGRAPVLVAIALIELGMAPLDAIEYIRAKRRGAFNKPQITYLDTYKKRSTTQHNSLRTSLSKMLGFGPKQAVVIQQT